MARPLTPSDARRALGAFMGATLARGRLYFAERRVGEIRAVASRSDTVEFHARVRGSRRAPYESVLHFDLRTGRLIGSDCTCPIAGYCKHTVATLQALEVYLVDGPDLELTRGTAEASGEPARLPEPRLDMRTESWLTLLGHTAVARDEAPVAGRVERLVFSVALVRADGSAPSQVQLRVDRVTIAADGTLGPRVIVSPSKMDWGRDPAVSPGDHALVIRMGSFTMGYIALSGADGARIFREVVATGRALLVTDDAILPLSEGPVRSGELAFDTDDRGGQLPTISIEGEVWVLPLTPPYYVDLSSGVTGRVEVADVPDAFAQTWLQGARVKPRDAAEVGRRLARARLPVRAPVPRVLPARTVDVAPTLVLRLESKLAPLAPRNAWEVVPDPPDRPWVRVFLDYGGVRVCPQRPDLERVIDGELVTLVRDEHAENELTLSLVMAGLAPTHRVFSTRLQPPGITMSLPKVSPFTFAGRIRALAATLSPPALVEEAPDYGFEALVADELSVGLGEIPEASDRFGVSLGIRIGEEIVDALPLVLAALRERLPEETESLVVPLPDGRAIVVSAARLAPIRALLLELLDRGPSEVSRVRAIALDPAVLSRSPESLAKLRAALASPARVALPRALKATLREYQREGFDWLMSRRRAHLGAVLADDMGLGKTVQTLALLLAEDRGGVPSLVVCPKTVLGNWEAEARRFAPKLALHVHHGVDRADRVDSFGGADVVLTTYALIVRDAELFASHRFATVVLDEAQAIKTSGSAVTHAACALRADFRLALSGTPMENHLGELWSVLRFAVPELFGDSRGFARAFRRPIERDGSDRAKTELRRRLAPFMLRRRKEEVASELPPKTIIVESVDLEDAQRDVYETVRVAMDARVKEAMAERGLAKSHIIVLDALLKLRQAVCDPRLLPAKTAKKAGSAKLDVLVSKLTELVAEGRRVLVFSQFVTMLELVQAELRRAKIPFLVLTGETQNRTELVAAFQRGDAPVFLLSLKAGGTGLNLTAADVVIHYDPWWNPAAEAQATDRAHRIGQDKSVLVYKLVGRATIEEKILVLQEKKQALFTSVLDDGAGAAKKLTAADVEFLFAR